MSSAAAGDPGALVDQTVGARCGAEPASTTLRQECQTGADANARDDCRIVGYVNSIQAYWTEAFADAGDATSRRRPRFFTGVDRDRLRLRHVGGRARSTARPTRTSTSTSGSSTSCRPQFGAKGGPFAEAYVLAHEYGHHVQDLIGTLEDAQRGPGAESAVGPHRAAGRLLRRRLGEPRRRAPATWSRSPRPQVARRPRRRGRGRRRPDPAADPGPGHPGDVDPRLVGAAPALVQDRPGDRRPDACDTSGDL